MQYHTENHIEDRPESIAFPGIYQNPSAPLTDSEMDSFIEEASRILTDTLSELEQGKEALPC